ncbi:phasin family protein [Alkalilimnicola ehrlichii]|uniref:phasin family protein n=1 Tax=Alkalilimnicola ehrlichii TaxID=351052 RepID=UPI003BA03C3F
MYEQFNKQFQAQFGDIFKQMEGQGEPVRRMVGLMLEGAEKYTQLQLDILSSWSDLTFSQARATLEISDQKSLTDYLESRQKLAEQCNQKLNEDAGKLVDLGRDFGEQVRKLAAESGSPLASIPAAAAAAPSASAPAQSSASTGSTSGGSGAKRTTRSTASKSSGTASKSSSARRTTKSA